MKKKCDICEETDPFECWKKDNEDNHLTKNYINETDPVGTFIISILLLWVLCVVVLLITL